MVGVVNHSNWLTFARTTDLVNDFPRVVIYINIRLSLLCFSLCKDVINHRDILPVLFFNNNNIFWLMNIYSDSSHSALKYLKDTKANIHNLLIMFDDFNIRDSLWDPLFPHHTFISDDFLIITDLFNLDLSNPTNQVLTRYSDNINDSNLVIDLMFLHSSSRELNNHSIYPEWYLTSYHASLTITIPIVEESVNSTKHSIIKDSDKETAFINDITLSIRNLNMSNLSDIVSLNNIVNDFTNKVNNAWEKSSKIINIMKHSKSW